MQFAFAEGNVTRLRREFKLLVSAEQAGVLAERLLMDLDGPPPEPTQITSVYFDRAGLPLAARAIATPHDCLKVRTKEYFPDLGADGGPRVVFEVKREKNGLTRKRRAWLPRAELASEMSADLAPVLAVTYQRQVFQRNAAWRVTVDHDVRFHPAPAPLAFGAEPVLRARLPREIDREDRVVVEVKHLGAELPDWLGQLRVGAAGGFSKFAEGMRRLHAETLSGWVGG